MIKEAENLNWPPIGRAKANWQRETRGSFSSASRACAGHTGRGNTITLFKPAEWQSEGFAGHLRSSIGF